MRGSVDALRAELSHLRSEIELIAEVASTSHVIIELRQRAEQLAAKVEEWSGGH